MMANKRKLLRGHYNPVNRYRKYPNLQWALVNPANLPSKMRARLHDNRPRRMKVCTSCIKRMALIN
jgi:ribosomal protein L28